MGRGWLGCRQLGMPMAGAGLPLRFPRLLTPPATGPGRWSVPAASRHCQQEVHWGGHLSVALVKPTGRRRLQHLVFAEPGVGSDGLGGLGLLWHAGPQRWVTPAPGLSSWPRARLAPAFSPLKMMTGESSPRHPHEWRHTVRLMSSPKEDPSTSLHLTWAFPKTGFKSTFPTGWRLQF